MSAFHRRLFHYFKMALTARRFWLGRRGAGWRGIIGFCFAFIVAVQGERLVRQRRTRRVFLRYRRNGGLGRKHHPLGIFAREYSGYVANGHADFARHAVKTRAELHHVVVDRQIARGACADVQHDLVILDVFHRHTRVCVDAHAEKRREATIAAPLINGAEKIRLGGNFTHGSGAAKRISGAWLSRQASSNR